MYSEEQFRAALEFATRKHEGQFRIGEKPYITHPVEVAEILKEKGYGLDYQIAGLFHDLLEDTDATEEEILQYGDEHILEAVRILTKEDHYVMEEYVQKIRANEMAFAVKSADRLHNLLSAVAAGEDFKRKYILETIDWYLDFDPQIIDAAKALAKTLDKPMTELSFLYEPLQKGAHICTPE